MRMWHAQLVVEAERLAYRFYQDEPLNEIERTLFKFIRQVAKWVSDFLAEFTNNYMEKRTSS